MQGYCKPFEGKKITLMGLGLLGRGVGDAQFLSECGARLTVTDKKTEAQLADSIAELKTYPNILFRLGGHHTEDFVRADMVIKAAGVPLDSPEIRAAHEAGISIAMSTALFAKYAMEAGAKIIGVTGTRGKSTVAHMIYHGLVRAKKHAHLGGNIRGRSTLAMLPEVEAGDIVVLELDSWQLQGFGDLEISPCIALFTNLMPDHINYYRGDMEKYFADKASIFRYQKAGDVLLCGAAVADRIRAAKPPLDPTIPERIPRAWRLRVLGEHNRENASLAKAALEACGLSEEEIQAGLESFEGVEGRLQFVREVGGVKIYNDNNATTPEATIAALHALGGGVTLIAGGSEKGLALDELVSEIKKSVSYVVLLAHPNYKGSERLAAVLKREGVRFGEAEDLGSALGLATKHAEKGSILFSPAFASFGMFKNEYDRNDQFLSLLKNL